MIRDFPDMPGCAAIHQGEAITAEALAADPRLFERPADFFAELQDVYGLRRARDMWTACAGFTDEEWRSVVGFEGVYEVSDFGRVRSLGRRVIQPHLIYRQPTRILKARLDPKGYIVVTLRRAGSGRGYWVSSLVAAAFIGPRPEGMHIAHGDGNPQHNRPSNLRYATRKENEADKLLHGTRLMGERSPAASITEEQARDIVHRYYRGEKLSDIGRLYGFGDGHVSHIVTGHRWAAATADVRVQYASSVRPRLARKPRERKGLGSACGNGHLYDESTLRFDGRGIAYCKICSREKARLYRARKAAA